MSYMHTLQSWAVFHARSAYKSICDMKQGRGSIPMREDGREADTTGPVCLEDMQGPKVDGRVKRAVFWHGVHAACPRQNKSPEDKEGKDRRKDFEAHRLGHGGKDQWTASDSPENLEIP